MKSKRTAGDGEGGRHTPVSPGPFPERKGSFLGERAAMEAVQLHRQLNDWHVAAQQPSRLAVCTEPRTKRAIKRQCRSSRGRLRSCSRWGRAAFPGLTRNIKGLVAVCHPGLDVWDLNGQRLASHTAGYKVSLKRKQTV